MNWEKIRSEFELVGQLELVEPGRLKFTRNLAALSVPSVYVVEHTSQAGVATVLYVGMTSGGWAKRVKEHNGGLNRVFFNKTNTQRFVGNYNQRVQWLSLGDKIVVFEKEASRTNVYGQSVPLQHAEEAALISILKPLHNWTPKEKAKGAA